MRLVTKYEPTPGALTREQKEVLLGGWGLGGEFADEAAMRQAWEANRTELMDIWFHPQGNDYDTDLMHWNTHGIGTRPWAWWKFDAPEPRKKSGGGAVTIPAGTEDQFYFGKPRSMHFDPNNPPLFESEASYLHRLSLLTPEERLRLTARDLNSADAPIHYKPECETR